MIGDGLTITWSFRSCQCVECDLAIHSLIWRIQRESKAKCFILYYINCCLAKFEGGDKNSVKSVNLGSFSIFHFIII